MVGRRADGGAGTIFVLREPAFATEVEGWSQRMRLAPSSADASAARSGPADARARLTFTTAMMIIPAPTVPERTRAS